MSTKENDTDLEPLLNTQQNQLSMVVSNGDGIDNKALALLATNIAILIFIGQADLQISEWWHYALLLIPYLLSLSVTASALQPKAYLGASIDLEQHPAYLSLSKEALLLQLLADTKEAIIQNQKVNEVHWRRCLIAAAFTAIGTAMLFAVL